VVTDTCTITIPTVAANTDHIGTPARHAIPPPAPAAPGWPARPAANTTSPTGSSGINAHRRNGSTDQPRITDARIAYMPAAAAPTANAAARAGPIC